ncbi:MAG TPA: hypothetical protein VG942_00450 [Hyphomonadaceae bacterium]|nr:hypothetical protein [Hyphomonadaceae bacterium]
MKTGLAFATAVAACALVSVSAVAPAAAQSKYDFDLSKLTPAQRDEMYCVYDGIDDKDALSVAIVYTDASNSDENVEAAQKILDAALSKCMTQYKWSGDDKDMAAQIGIAGVVNDVSVYLLDDAAKSLKVKPSDRVREVLDTLSDGDLDMILAGIEQADDAFEKKLTAALSAKGITGDDARESAFHLMTASVEAASTMHRWISRKAR